LGLDRPTVERAQRDNAGLSNEQVNDMLQKWKRKEGGNATFRNLFKAMQECNDVTTIEWSIIKEKLHFDIGKYTFCT